jgi:hypothetical protein
MNPDIGHGEDPSVEHVERNNHSPFHRSNTGSLPATIPNLAFAA